MTSLEQYAQECAGNWKEFDSFGWHGKPDWADRAYIWNIEHRDSDMVTASNADAIRAELEPFVELGQAEFQHFNHWAYGWCEAAVVMVYDDEGNITDAFKVVVELNDRLEDYPILDEEDYCQREYDEQHECIKDNLPELREGLTVDDDLVHEVWSWIWNNDQYALYRCDPGWVDTEAITEACIRLGYLAPDCVSCAYCDRDNDTPPCDTCDDECCNYVLKEE